MKRNKKFSGVATLISTCVGLLSSNLSYAVEQKSVALEEIVVTAQKREESLQDVAISVAAVTGDELAARNENEISELAKLVPGFTFSDGFSDADRSVLIRGVGTQSFSRGVDQSVGTSVDGVIVGNIAASLLDFSDVSRIEVLRGPQGLLFGKNASAGLLNIATNNPTPELEFGAGFSYAEENEVKVNGYLSGPLSGDSVLGRVSFYSNQRDGILENRFPGGSDFNDRDEWGVRAKLLVEPSEEFSILLGYTHAERDLLCCAMAAREPIPGGLLDTLGVPAGPENDVIVENDFSINDVELDIYSAELNYELGDYTLTSITSFSEADFLDDVRGSGLPVTVLIANTGNADTQQFTQEFRLTSPLGDAFDYVVGLYYYQKEEKRTFFRVIDFFALGQAPFPGVMSSVESDATVDVESLAAFGQVTWNITERARLSVGARYNHEDISIFQIVTNPIPFTIPEAIGIRDDETTDDAISWRVIAEYDLFEEAMIYASVARGYKGPGANTLASSLDRPGLVDPEIPTNYEIGIKSEWWDNRLRLNASLFHTTFEDFQTSITEADTIPASFFLGNAEELQTQGLELEVDAQLTEHLSISASLNYLDAEFTDFENSACYDDQTVAQGCIDGVQDLSGKDTPNSPEWSYTISGLYTVPFESLPFDGFVRASYYWQDDVQYNANNDPATIGDSYGVADLSIGINSDDGRYSIQLFAKNLFDEFYQSTIVSSSVLGGVTHNLPYAYQRRLGVSAQIRF